jgi:membrane protease YdiL (CAAX protease family)
MEPKENGKTAFHVALAGVFLPGAGQLLSVILAASYGFRGGAWGRRLAKLGGVDLLVFAAVVVLASRPESLSPPLDGPRVGVLFEEGGTTVKSVVDGWPAAEAGVRAGDVIRAVDGVPTASQADLIRTIREGTGERVLAIDRGGTSIEIRVTPRRPRPETRGFFEPHPSEWSLSLGWKEAVGYGVTLVVMTAAWLVGRRRPGPRVWRGFLLADVLFLAAGVGAGYAVHRIQGGMSTGGTLLTLLAGHAGLGLGGLLASLWLRSDRPAEPPPARSWLRALGLAAYYTITAYPRAGFVLVAVDTLFLGGAGKPPDALEGFASTLHGPAGVVLFVLVVAALGPVAEEIVFRGLLLPRLAARIGRGGALAATSLIFGAMHANYGIYAPLTVVLGWTLGWSRLASGDLRAPIALHMLLNGAVSAVYFLR